MNFHVCLKVLKWNTRWRPAPECEGDHLFSSRDVARERMADFWEGETEDERWIREGGGKVEEEGEDGDEDVDVGDGEVVEDEIDLTDEICWSRRRCDMCLADRIDIVEVRRRIYNRGSVLISEKLKLLLCGGDQRCIALTRSDQRTRHPYVTRLRKHFQNFITARDSLSTDDSRR